MLIQKNLSKIYFEIRLKFLFIISFLRFFTDFKGLILFDNPHKSFYLASLMKVVRIICEVKNKN